MVGKESCWGLAAYGRSGNIEVEVHESIGDEEAWELSVDTPSVNLRVRMPSPEIVGQIVAFLDEDRAVWAEMEVGHIGGATVLLVCDDPPTVRYWLKALPNIGFLELAFADDAAVDLRDAFRDAFRDLRDGAG